MKTSKKIIITLCIALIIVSGYAFTVTSLSSNDNSKEEPKSTETSPVYYIVKQYKDRIAVYSSEKDEPIQILDSPFVRDLPEYDQKLLSKGIIVKTNEELLKILEDYDNWLLMYSWAAK